MMKYLALLILALILPLAGQAQVTLDGTAITTETIAHVPDTPTFLTAPPGDPRLFVVQKSGLITILDDPAAPPFLDLTAQVSTNSERGLLGLAFHPDYARNHRFFIYYTDHDGTLQIAELHTSDDPGIADPASLKHLISIPHPNGNHNGGWLGFGPDGFLYIATGDGGGGGDPQANGQNPDTLLGKLLRIDVDHGDPYAIPPTNPFATGGGAPEIFAMGLRNPWRNAFDGDTLYIADVGQDKYEEIDILPALTPGLNFGWNIFEGFDCYRTTTCDPTGLTQPIHVYDHDKGCSVTGGYVYRGTALPALQGRYLFSDFCTGGLHSLRYDGKATSVTFDAIEDLEGITSFGQDSSGELYLLLSDGRIEKLIPAP